MIVWPTELELSCDSPPTHPALCLISAWPRPTAPGGHPPEPGVCVASFDWQPAVRLRRQQRASRSKASTSRYRPQPKTRLGVRLQRCCRPAQPIPLLTADSLTLVLANFTITPGVRSGRIQHPLLLSNPSSSSEGTLTSVSHSTSGGSAWTTINEKRAARSSRARSSPADDTPFAFTAPAAARSGHHQAIPAFKLLANVPSHAMATVPPPFPARILAFIIPKARRA